MIIMLALIATVATFWPIFFGADEQQHRAIVRIQLWVIALTALFIANEVT